VTDALEEARAAEAEARARLAAAVTERTRAEREADRLDGRAALPGADPAVATAAGVQRGLAQEAAERVEALRAEVRRVEGRVATLEAEADAGPAAEAG
jgi:hypothetical protein